jgi:hypothetical protein
VASSLETGEERRVWKTQVFFQKIVKKVGQTEGRADQNQIQPSFEFKEMACVAF